VLKAQQYKVQLHHAKKGDGILRLLQPCGFGRFQRVWAWASYWSLVLALTLITPSVLAETPTTEPLAEVNAEAITTEDLREALGVKLAKLEGQIYAVKRQQLDTLIEEKLLAHEATKRGMSVPALLDAEVTGKVSLVTETEVEAFYKANKTRLRGDKAEARQKIRAALQGKKLAAQRKQFVSVLRSQTTVVDNLQLPPITRVEVSTDEGAVRGMAEAPVTLVEFSDFHCPFCKRVQPTLEKLLVKYPKQVKLVFRDFPLDKLHPQAREAAEAARCAKKQGKFWEYHDLLFATAPRASPKDLETYAHQVGIDGRQFVLCLSDGGPQAAVQQDVEEGSRLGITGTPMFFINGRPLSGALPLERFVQVIEEELAQAQVASEKAAPAS
jgi:protein-disulfide isomerase